MSSGGEADKEEEVYLRLVEALQEVLEKEIQDLEEEKIKKLQADLEAKIIAKLKRAEAQPVHTHSVHPAEAVCDLQVVLREILRHIQQLPEKIKEVILEALEEDELRVMKEKTALQRTLNKIRDSLE